MLGVLLAFILFFILLIGIVSLMFSSIKEERVASVKPNSILHIEFNYFIKERTSENPLEDFDFGTFEPKIGLGLNDIIESIKKAKTDPNIEGIYLDITELNAQYATIEEIRNALLSFKKSGKFITSYSEVYTQKTYYLASVADKIFLNPEGLFEFTGFSYNMPFFKGTLEKLEVEAQVVKVGTYKSAVEPFVLDKMSDANRLQVQSFINHIYQHFLSKISEARDISVEQLDTISTSLLIHNPKDAIESGMVDSLYYKDQVLASLRNDLKIGMNAEINSITLKKYSKTVGNRTQKKFTKKKIAIIYASGDIVSGKGKPDEIGSETISKAIREARLDTNIKAIVLRINSPGGSALASDVIWRETMLVKEVKPLIVSMSDLAASGGYYIACAADTIVAQPNTITGSIGVFGLLFNAQKFLNNKLGITFDGVKTGKYSDIGTPTRPLSESERFIIQKEVNNIYEDFISRVSNGRKISLANVDSIAQGRVWSGTEAKQIGLVDVLGGIDTAINIAVRMANLDEYKIVELPGKKEFPQVLIEELMGEVKMHFVKNELDKEYNYYKQIKSLLNMQGIQARLPFEIEIN